MCVYVLENLHVFSGLKLKFNGESEVIWHESHQSGSKGFQQKESYFYSKLVIIGDGIVAIPDFLKCGSIACN